MPERVVIKDLIDIVEGHLLFVEIFQQNMQNKGRSFRMKSKVKILSIGEDKGSREYRKERKESKAR
jgi:hypothetical protein